MLKISLNEREYDVTVTRYDSPPFALFALLTDESGDTLPFGENIAVHEDTERSLLLFQSNRSNIEIVMALILADIVQPTLIHTDEEGRYAYALADTIPVPSKPETYEKEANSFSEVLDQVHTELQNEVVSLLVRRKVLHYAKYSDPVEGVGYLIYTLADMPILCGELKFTDAKKIIRNGEKMTEHNLHVHNDEDRMREIIEKYGPES